MSDRLYRQPSHEANRSYATDRIAHSRAQSGVSHTTSLISGEPSVEVASIPLVRDDGIPLSPSYPSLSTPLSTQPPVEAFMKRGIRRHMESGGGRGTIAPRTRVAVRSVGGSFHHAHDAIGWPALSPGGVSTLSTNHPNDAHAGTAHPSQQPVQAPYWQDTQQHIPRTWLQYASSPALQMLRAGTPSSHSIFQGEASTSSNGGAGGSGSGGVNETSALFTPTLTDSGAISMSMQGVVAVSPTGMPAPAHRRGTSLMLEPPTQMPLVPPYDGLPAAATIGDYIMGHSPVGHVDLTGGTAGFDAEANDAVREYTDAMRRRQRSPSASQAVQSARFRPLPILFGAAQRNSPWQLQFPSDTNTESPCTEEALNSSTARLVSPPDALVDSVLYAPTAIEEGELRPVPDSLAHTQRPAPRTASQTVNPQPFHRYHQRRRSSLHLYPSSLGSRGLGGAGSNNYNSISNPNLTLSQSQPSLGVPAISLPDPFMTSPAGNLGLASGGGGGGHHSSGSTNSLVWQHQRGTSGISLNRATFPWDQPSMVVPANASARTAAVTHAGSPLAPVANGARPASPNAFWARNPDNSFVLAAARPGAAAPLGGGTGSHSHLSSAEREAGGRLPGSDSRRTRLTPGSVENHPLPINTSCCEEMADLLDVYRLLNSDVENVYGMVPSSQHNLQEVLVNVLTALTAYLQAFYGAFCALPFVHAASHDRSVEAGGGAGISVTGGESGADPALNGSLHVRHSSSSLHTSSSSSADVQDLTVELAQQLICDLEFELLPPLTSFHKVETGMQESRRRKELVAFWAVDVTSAMARQLNSALMAAAGQTPADCPAMDTTATESMLTSDVLADADTSLGAPTMTMVAASTRPRYPSMPEPARTAPPCDAATLADVETLADWLGDADRLKHEIEVVFPQLLNKYLTVAVEKCVLDIAVGAAQDARTAATPAPTLAEPEKLSSALTQFPAALAALVAALVDPETGVRDEVEVDLNVRVMPTMEEITDEFSDLSEAASWSWWYSRQELYLTAPRTQAQCQRVRTAAIRAFCDRDARAQQFLRDVAADSRWAEQALEQQQLTAAQLDGVLDELKVRGEAALRMTLRYAIVRYVMRQPGVREARSPAEALATQLYRHLGSLHSTLSELSQSSTEIGQDASAIGGFVRVAKNGLRAYKAALSPRDTITTTTTTKTTADMATAMSSTSADSALANSSDDTARSRPHTKDMGTAQRAVEAFLAAFSAEEHSSPLRDVRSATPSSHVPAPSSPPAVPHCAHSLLFADGHALPPHLSTLAARCTFVKTLHSASLCAAQQICTMLQSAHYTALRDESTQQVQAATATATLPIFSNHHHNNKALTRQYLQSGAYGHADSSGNQSSSWEAPRPSARALKRLQQSLCDVYVSLDRNRRVLSRDASLK